MKLNLVKTDKVNPAVEALFKDNSLIITIDANILIPPDRSKYVKLKPLPFAFYKDSWLDVIFEAFSGLAIHEAVLAELEGTELRNFVQLQLNKVPPKLKLLSDFDFTESERIYRDSIERAVAYHTAYDPEIDNRDDRGEVKSLAHIATKRYLYFCSRDRKALRLVEDAEKLETHLDELETVQPYEIIYYLIKNELEDRAKLRTLYKYIYYASPSDKAVNPSWDEFIREMDKLYQ